MYRVAETGVPTVPKPNRVTGPDVPHPEPEEQRALGLSGAAAETVEPKRRRRFAAAEKLRILKAADAAVASGKRGALEALLRREAIYSSHLSA
jgi:hypothetical protein